MPDYNPKSLDRAFFAMRADPKCIPFAGGLSFEGAENPHYLYLGQIPELDKAHNREDCIGTGIGAAMTLQNLMEVKSVPMLLRRAAASVPEEIRTKATVGGSVCSLDKRSDILPVLFTLQASAVVRTRVTEKIIPLTELYKGGKKELPKEALVTAVIVPYDSFTNASYEKCQNSDGIKVSVTGIAKVSGGVVRQMRVTVGGIVEVPVTVDGVSIGAVGLPCTQIKQNGETYARKVCELAGVSDEAVLTLAQGFFAKL